MEQLGFVFERPLFYCKGLYNLDATLLSNWVLFSVVDEKNDSLSNKLIETCLTNNVGYICSAGNQAEYIHDCFDEVIAFKAAPFQLATAIEYTLSNMPITTWHTNFDEGLWYAGYNAMDDAKVLDKIICIDLTEKGVRQHIQTLIKKINTGWLPNDEEVVIPAYDSQ